jgi:hypothetical protein
MPFRPILILLSLFTLGCGPAEAEERRSVIVNDVGFAIPTEFFHELAIPPDNSTETTVLLVVELPNITRLTKPDVADYYKEEKMRYTRVKISSPFNDDGSSRKDLAARFTSHQKHSKTTRRVADVYGLHYLTRPEAVRMDREEMLYEGAPDNPLTLVFCDEQPGYLPFPACRMQFHYDSLVVEVDFRRRDWLADWQSIKRTTLLRLEEFHNAYLEDQQKERGG